MTGQRMIARPIAALICSLVVACSGGSDTTTSASTATTVPVTTTTIPPGPAAELPPSGCCDGIEIPAGTYELPAYWGTPLTVVVGDGWRAVFDNSAALMAFVQGQNAVADPSRWLYLIRAPVDVPPEDVIADMAAMTSISVTADPEAVEIAGFPGVQLEATANHDPDQPEVPANGIEAGAIRLEALNDTGYFPTGFLVATATRESTLRFVALDVGGRTMLALIDAPPDEFAAFADEATAVLDSLTTPPA